MVTEARARKQAGYNGKDVWIDNLHPGAAVRARTIPLLEAEKRRLQAQLDEVRPFDLLDSPVTDMTSYTLKLDATNRKLQEEMQRNVKAREEIDQETSGLLDILDAVSILSFLLNCIFLTKTVCANLQTCERWNELPMEDIQAWGLQTAESATNSRPLLI